MEKIRNLFTNKYISALIAVIGTAAGIILCLHGEFSAFIKLMPPVLLLVAVSFLKHWLYPAAGAAICLVWIIAREGAGFDGYFYPQYLRVLIGGALLCTANYVLFCAGAARAAARFIAQKTKTRRGIITGALAASLILSPVPEAAVAIGGSGFAYITRRLGISREKLAFVVNAGAVLLAGSFFVSVWSGDVASAVRTGLDLIGGELIDALAFMTTTVQYNFFAISMLVVLAMSTMQVRDMWPLLQTELAARSAFDPKKFTAEEIPAAFMKKAAAAALIPNAAFAIVFAAAFVGAVRSSMTASSAGSLGAVYYAVRHAAWGNVSLLAGGVALITALLGCAYLRVKHPEQKERNIPNANLPDLLMPAVWMLVSCMLIIAAAKNGTYAALAELISANISSAFLPTLCFAAAFAVGLFSGNCSTSCMAVLPLAIPACWNAMQEPAFYYTMGAGAVFAGALAGTLCAPHAPLNIVAALVSGCSPQRHMYTQIPYVLLCAVISCVFGYFPLSIGFGTTFGLFLVPVATYALYDCLSKRPDRIKN